MFLTFDSSTPPLIPTGYPTSWMPLPGPYHSLVKRVRNPHMYCKNTNLSVFSLVTDMLLALLNCCTKEELEESSDEETLISPTTPSEESQERRKVIKNKILAVGRMSRVFALLRCVTFVICCASMI